MPLYIHLEDQGGYGGFAAVNLLFYFLETGSRLTSQWAPGGCLSPFPNANCRNMQPGLGFYMGAGDLNSVPCVFITSTFTVQTSVISELES